jgi:hypothetical protein
MMDLVILLYMAIAFAFALPTYREGRTSNVGGSAWRIIGLLLCLAWPALTLCVMLEVVRSKREFAGGVGRSHRSAPPKADPAR